VVELLLTLFGIIAVFIGMIWAGGFATTRLVGRAVQHQHEQTDWIMETRTAPKKWSRGQHRVLRFIHAAGLPRRMSERVKAFFKRRLELRLARLMRYFERASFFPDEDTRDTYVNAIRHIGYSWEQSTWEEITGSGERE
jgi:hypothetical protein